MVVRVLVQNLCSIGEQAMTSERVFEADFAIEDVNRWPDALQRHARLAERVQRIRLSEPDEGQHGLAVVAVRCDDRLGPPRTSRPIPYRVRWHAEVLCGVVQAK